MKKIGVVLTLGFCCALVLSIAGCGGQATWTDLKPAGDLPSGRSGHSMVCDGTNTQVILFGGGNSDGPFGDTWAYDLRANTWTELHPTGDLPVARAFYTMAEDPSSGHAIIFGGSIKHGVLNDTWAYDPAANTWTELHPAGHLPVARAFCAMVYEPTSSRVILFGGVNADGALNDTWAYDPAANTWTELHPAGDLPVARSIGSMIYDPATSKIILFGGATEQDVSLGDTWAYDPGANTWAELHPAGDSPSPRGANAFAYDPRSAKIVLFGGSDGPHWFNDTWAYDPGANTWAELHPAGDLPPRGCSPTWSTIRPAAGWFCSEGSPWAETCWAIPGG